MGVQSYVPVHEFGKMLRGDAERGMLAPWQLQFASVGRSAIRIGVSSQVLDDVVLQRWNGVKTTWQR